MIFEKRYGSRNNTFICYSLKNRIDRQDPKEGEYMKLKNMKIGALLLLILGIFLGLVAILGSMTWIETDILWLQTKTMYDHPVQIRRAISSLQADILTMHRGMKDLMLTQNDQETDATLKEIESHRTNALLEIQTLQGKYLGPKSDVDTVQAAFEEWHVIREETIRLLRQGKTAEAIARTKSTGPGGQQAAVLIDQIQKMDKFARGKSDQLYRNALARKNLLNTQTSVVVGVILLLSVIIFWFLMKSIKDPLQELTGAAEQIRLGKMDVRCRYASTNEFGILSTTFNAMADTVETQLQTLTSQAELLDLAHDAILVRDSDDIIRYWNRGAEKTYGWTKEEAVGEKSHDLLQPQLPRSFEDSIASTLATGQWEGELRHITRDGLPIVVASRWTVRKNLDGEPVEFLEINRDITERMKMVEEREHLIAGLQNALANVKLLSGLIPICASCKMIRDDKGYWNQIESYIRDHSEAEFSHGICPDCAKKLYPDIFK